MHARVTHESSYAAARDEAKEIGEMPLELHIMDGNGEPYEFWEKLELRAYDNGHGYMEGIFNPGAAERDPVSRAHFETLTGAYGEERAREILGDWEASRGKFVKVMPTDYRRALGEMWRAANQQQLAA
ncbi:hypothetical protein G6F50_016791 [Rhizopus delemar]|uniref:Uncharacterized protein n=1 Tax=Rhizopus delemar TaxID=936053 RepID=A0A9P6XRV8_9FUNG|nr:hypothetical protein G6F50_016791 [Rhizopus delemar]